MDDATVAARMDALRDAYAALNRNDIPAFLEVFAPDVQRTEPAGFPGSGTYRGIDALKAHTSLHRGKWAEGGCEPERFVAAGERMIAFVHVRVRLNGEADWREGHIADAFAFRGNKVIQFITFVDRSEALSWAGVDAGD